METPKNYSSVSVTQQCQGQKKLLQKQQHISSSTSSSTASSSRTSSSSSRKKVLSYPDTGGVILRLGTLPEPWESENMLEDLHHS